MEQFYGTEELFWDTRYSNSFILFFSFELPGTLICLKSNIFFLLGLNVLCFNGGSYGEKDDYAVKLFIRNGKQKITYL